MAESAAAAAHRDDAGSDGNAAIGPGAAAGPNDLNPTTATDAGSAAEEELRHKQQQLNSLALAFLADPGNMQRAFAAAQSAAQGGDDSSLKAVYAAAQLARQLEVRP